MKVVTDERARKLQEAWTAKPNRYQDTMALDTQAMEQGTQLIRDRSAALTEFATAAQGCASAQHMLSEGFLCDTATITHSVSGAAQALRGFAGAMREVAAIQPSEVQVVREALTLGFDRMPAETWVQCMARLADMMRQRRAAADLMETIIRQRDAEISLKQRELELDFLRRSVTTISQSIALCR